MKPSIRYVFLSICIVSTIYYIFYLRQPSPIHHGEMEPFKDMELPTIPKVSTVVASQSHDNTTWYPSHFPDWQHNIYVTDILDAHLSVAANKGRESMVYLTYIIDNYFSLPDIVLFLHAEQYQWHNDDPLYDGARLLSRIQFPHVLDQGYVNLRCVWVLGCPSEIHPLVEQEHRESEDTNTGDVYATAYRELFPGVEIPETVGVSCCAQFAVSREKLLSRSLEDYTRYRQWLLDTTLPDELSGRVMEYSWHMILGQEPVHCPSAETCYCNVFGLCDLECESENGCNGRYTLPKYSTLPQGWPRKDWEGNWQNASMM